MKLVTKRFNVASGTTNRTWCVSEYDDGSYSCSCPAWIFHKGTKVNCKHINEILNQKESTLTITGLTTAQAEIVMAKAIALSKEGVVV